MRKQIHGKYSHAIKLADHAYNAYQLLSPGSWEKILDQLFSNHTSCVKTDIRRTNARVKQIEQFRPVVEELREYLRTNYEQDMHWLIERPELKIFTFALNFLLISSGSRSLRYTN